MDKRADKLIVAALLRLDTREPSPAKIPTDELTVSRANSALDLSALRAVDLPVETIVDAVTELAKTAAIYVLDPREWHAFFAAGDDIHGSPVGGLRCS